jgi:MOSC domain-containing protein YiiM
MTTLPQGALPFDPAILHTVNGVNRTWAGVYAGVPLPGAIKAGDPVMLLEE